MTLENRIDVLFTRLNEAEKRTESLTRDLGERVYQLDRHFDQRCDALSVRLDALEAAREPTKDCALLCDNGALLGLMTRAEAERMAQVSSGTVLRFAPAEPKP